MKQISVIIPIYNAEKWLIRLCETLKKQTVYNDLEIIFVNDGSEDNSLDIIENFSRVENNVIVINQKNSGVSAARNKGIEKATCEYIAFVDADDYLDNDYFETYINKLDKKYDLIVSGYIAEYSSGYVTKKINEPLIIENREEIIKKFLLGKVDPNCWNKIYKTDIIKTIKFDETMAFGEDKDLLFKYLITVDSVCFISYAKYHYYISDESVMRKKFNDKLLKTLEKSTERKDIIEKEIPELSEYANSSDIDVKCRVLCSLVEFNVKDEYIDVYKKLRKEISQYSIFKKKKYSTKKHFYAFLAIRLSPRLYLFLKNRMKLQYK